MTGPNQSDRGTRPFSGSLYLSSNNITQSKFALHPTWPCLIHANDLSIVPSGWFTMRRILSSSAHSALPHVLSLSHAHSGGVLQGQWLFYSNRQFVRQELDFRSAADPLHSIRHVVNPTTPLPATSTCTGRRVAAATSTKAILRTGSSPASKHRVSWGLNIQSSPLGCEALLPASAPGSVIRCPSVFTSSGWVDRSLTLPELMSAFDVPPQAHPRGRPDKGEKVPFGCCFLVTPPIKLLQRCLECWAPEMAPIQYEEKREVPGTTARESEGMYIQDDQKSGPRAEFALSTKADDAEAFTEMWNDRIWERVPFCHKRKSAFACRYAGRCPLDAIRAGCLRRWRKNVLTSLIQYLRHKHGDSWSTSCRDHPDLVAGRLCLFHCAGANWWEWQKGSTLLFWQWPPQLQQGARDGHPIWIRDSLPSYRVPQKTERDSVRLEQIKAKLNNIREKRYVGRGTIQSLTGYFAVPKGPSDVRMVYDASKTGLNAALWVPSFALPATEDLLDLLDSNSWMGDLDKGEMFFNFPLDINVRPYCGIDLRPYLYPNRQQGNTWWEAWQRCVMGLVASPYICTKEAALADEVARGNPSDPSNPFQWTAVVLNLPGSPDYSPRLPWVFRVRADGHMASDVVTYVDDMRSVGHSRDSCWEVGHTLACWYSWLGIQVTSRKTRPPSQTPGAWAGAVVSTGAQGVGVKCSQDKCDKAKALLQDILAELERSDQLQYKPLEQKRGFFIHLQRTYPCITPFLKGFHNTLDGWRAGRDTEGWKLTRRDSTLGFWDDSLQKWISFDSAPDRPPPMIPPAP
jgi:hypothetical protein